MTKVRMVGGPENGKFRVVEGAVPSRVYVRSGGDLCVYLRHDNDTLILDDRRSFGDPPDEVDIVEGNVAGETGAYLVHPFSGRLLSPFELAALIDSARRNVNLHSAVDAIVSRRCTGIFVIGVAIGLVAKFAADLFIP